LTRHTSQLVGQWRLDHTPFEVRQVVYRLMPALSQATTANEGDVRASAGMTFGAMSLQPLNAL